MRHPIQQIQRTDISELVNQGWKIAFDDFEERGPLLAISTLRNWKQLSWAQRIFYRAKYDFNDDGVLEIGLTGESAITIRSASYVFRLTSLEEPALPSGRLPGANDRLREMLSPSNVKRELNGYARHGLACTGPDGSVLLTSEDGWGVAFISEGGYTEIDHKYFCLWEDDLGTFCPDIPWWAYDLEGFSTGDSENL